MKNKVINMSAVIFTIVVLAILILVLSGKYRNTDTIFNKVGVRFFDFNKVTVNAYNIDEKSVKVFWRCESDSALIYENGEYLNGIKNKKGIYVFNVFINEKKRMILYHFNSQNWYSNNYVFSLTSKNDSLFVDAQTDGFDKKIDIVSLP